MSEYRTDAPAARGLEPDELELVRRATEPIVEYRDHPHLREFCARKHISPEMLHAVGVRVQTEQVIYPEQIGSQQPLLPNVLAAFGPRSVKYRRIVTHREGVRARWSMEHSSMDAPWLVGNEASGTVIVVEGETDAARMIGETDAAVLLIGGAKNAELPAIIEALRSYERVVVATDADEDGDEAANRIGRHIRHAERWRPEGAKDWCELEQLPPLPDELPPARARRFGVVMAAAVKAEPVYWMWQNYIPLAKPTVLGGQEGKGKGLLSAWLSARTSLGELEGDLRGVPSNVLIVGDEDAISDTWKWRLVAAGADQERVAFLDGLPDFSSDADMMEVNETVEELGAKLVIFDALLDHLGNRSDEFRMTDVRKAMKPVRRLAATQRCAVLGVMHPKKGQASSYRDQLAGSHQFVAANRSGLLLAQNPNSEDERDICLAHAKTNLGRKAPVLDMRIDTTELTLNGFTKVEAHLTGFTLSELTTDALLSQTGADKSHSLLSSLAPGGPGKTLEELAEEHGVTAKTVRSWVRKLDGEVVELGNMPGRGGAKVYGRPAAPDTGPAF